MSDSPPRLPCAFWKGIIYPLLFWIAFTPFSARLDVDLTRLLYPGEAGIHPFWEEMYRYGPWLSLIIVGSAFIGLIFSFKTGYRRLRIPSLYLILTLAIGSGLLIHAGLKDHWGRPRPKQVKEFGGQQAFRPYYSPNFNNPEGPSKSFSCGHCSTGFYFFAPAFVALSFRRKTLYRFVLGFAIVLGVTLSLGRIVQGGHFLSDTIASAIIMWMTSWTLANFLLFTEKAKDERIDP